MSAESPLIAVLGAGVIGLHAALALLEKGYRVAIVAREWPGSENAGYTSMWAGAQWRSTSLMTQKHMQDWERSTFKYWQRLTAQLPTSATGVARKTGIYYWDSSASQGRKAEDWIWWLDFLPELRRLSIEEIPVQSKDGKPLEGVTYQSFAISPEQYMKFLHQSCEELGAMCVQAEVADLRDVFSLPSLQDAVGIVNCAGITGTKLVDDPDFYPTKGQAVIVKGEANRISTGLGRDWEAVVVPRIGQDETFLGVTKIYGDGSRDIDDEATKMILDRAKPLVPELLDADGNFKVLRVQVGLRPTRTGGARVEMEELSDQRWICHNYGHHGAGFEESFGSGETVVGLVEQILAERASTKTVLEAELERSML